MAGSILSYEDLAVWQEAMRLVEMTYGIIRRLPSAERYSMSPQMARAAVSIPANIAEGHGSGLRRVYLYHLTMSRGSLAELETYLDLVVRLGYCKVEQVNLVREHARSVGRMLNGLIRSLNTGKNAT